MSLVEEYHKYKHLEKEYTYFHTMWYDSKPKTGCFLLLTNSHEEGIGIVKWYAPWRQYCFFPQSKTVFSRGCMREINEFIDLLMNDRKEESQTE